MSPSNRHLSRLLSAVMLLTAVPLVAIAATQEALQFNVPYRCPDGTTNIIHRCEATGRGEVCFWSEERNGKRATERQSARRQMNGWLQFCKVKKEARAGTNAAEQNTQVAH